MVWLQSLKLELNDCTHWEFMIASQVQTRNRKSINRERLNNDDYDYNDVDNNNDDVNGDGDKVTSSFSLSLYHSVDNNNSNNNNNRFV